jgi:hypothetical protein
MKTSRAAIYPEQGYQEHLTLESEPNQHPNGTYPCHTISPRFVGLIYSSNHFAS